MRQLEKLRLRCLRTVFFKDRVENDLDEELRYHVERTVEQLVAKGTNPTEARRQAILEFGGTDYIKEACRDMRGLNLPDNLKQDFRYSGRSLRREPLLVLAAELGGNSHASYPLWQELEPAYFFLRDLS